MHANRTKIMLVFALLLAVAASYMAYSWLQKRAGQSIAETEIPTKTVVVATVEIPYGMTIDVAQLKSVNWPADLLPENSITNMDEIVGKVASRTIYPEDVITTKRIADHAGGSHLAALISKNKRAITIRVDDVVGVGGFLMPGNHVDVIGVRPIPKTRRVETRTVMKDVVVLAVDQDISPDESKPKVVRAVTLEMLPESTLKVLKAANEGKIQLVLRNPADKYQVAQAPKRVVKRKPAPRKVEKPKPFQVTVIRGTEVDSVKPRS